MAKFKGEIAILGQILARWPFWKVHKAKMKGNESPKNQMKGNEGPKGQNDRKGKPKRRK